MNWRLSADLWFDAQRRSTLQQAATQEQSTNTTKTPRGEKKRYNSARSVYLLQGSLAGLAFLRVGVVN